MDSKVLSMVENYKDGIISSFVKVCKNNGYSVDTSKLDFSELLNEIFCSCTSTSDLQSLLDDIIGDGLIVGIEGVEIEED